MPNPKRPIRPAKPLSSELLSKRLANETYRFIGNGDDRFEKKCHKCSTWYLATTEFFDGDSSRPDGLCHQCKKCSQASDRRNQKIKRHYQKKSATTIIVKAKISPALRKRREKVATIRTIDGETEKLCPVCKEWWPADSEFFTVQKRKADGLDWRCKACKSEADHAKQRSHKKAKYTILNW